MEQMKKKKLDLTGKKILSILAAGMIICTLTGAAGSNAVMASENEINAAEPEAAESAAETTTGNWPVDINKSDCSIDLSLSYQKDGKTVALSGGSLALYTVAAVREENGYVFDVAAGKFASVEGVSKIPSMNSAELDKNNADLANAMAAAATSGNIKADAEGEIRSGKVSFQNLKAGLYLIMQQKASDGNRRINPFLISIPDEKGKYNLSAAPKNGIDIPATPTPVRRITPKITVTQRPKVTTTVRKTTVLPKTGQEWWPVCVLAVIGVAALTAGRRVRTE